MGIKKFYCDFKRIFKGLIQKKTDKSYNMIIIEINGIFYSSATSKSMSNIEIFRRICERIKMIIQNLVTKDMFDKKKQIVVLLVMDGLAPLIKIMTQKRRRLYNMMRRSVAGKDCFDSNHISVGTLFTSYLSKYIDWYLRKTINDNELPQEFEYFFSNEKVYGEGEIKSSKFIRSFAGRNDRILVYSNDSDWILNSILLRDYDLTIMRNYLDGAEFISNQNVIELLYEKYAFNDAKDNFITDIFVLLTLLGNDYIDRNPDVNGLDHFIHILLPEYRKLGKNITNKSKLDIKNLKELTLHYFNRNCEKNDIPKESQVDRVSLVCDYLYLIENILKMNMINHEFDRHFYYQHESVPSLLFIQFISDDVELDKMKTTKFEQDNDNAYKRLLSILPRSSFYLLPKTLQSFPCNDNHVMYNVDKNEISFLPGTLSEENIKINSIQEFYEKNEGNLTEEERTRILPGRLFKYKYKKGYAGRSIYSYYGNLKNNHVQITVL